MNWRLPKFGENKTEKHRSRFSCRSRTRADIKHGVDTTTKTFFGCETGTKPSMVMHFKRRISPAAIARSIDFEPFLISITNALSSFATSGFTHPWMSICRENQIQSNLKTVLRQTKLGFLIMSHTATPTTTPDSSTSRTT
jgi:hypothetical protein